MGGHVKECGGCQDIVSIIRHGGTPPVRLSSTLLLHSILVTFKLYVLYDAQSFFNISSRFTHGRFDVRRLEGRIDVSTTPFETSIVDRDLQLGPLNSCLRIQYEV